MKRDSVSANLVLFLITYLLVKIIQRLTGFDYDFSEGLFNIKLLIDLLIWIAVYRIVSILFNNFLFS